MIFHDFLKCIQIIIKGHPRYLHMFEGSERPFPVSDCIFEHFRPYGRPYCERSKYVKIAKIVIWVRNSIFDISADIGRNDDIWPEMGSWGVLELFCTRNRYLNAFRSNFKKFQKNRFFGDFHLWDPKMWTRRIFYGSRNFDVEISTGPNTSKLF